MALSFQHVRSLVSSWILTEGRQAGPKNMIRLRLLMRPRAHIDLRKHLVTRNILARFYYWIQHRTLCHRRTQLPLRLHLSSGLPSLDRLAHALQDYSCDPGLYYRNYYTATHAPNATLSLLNAFLETITNLYHA